MTICPRCGGAILTDGYGDLMCWSCGRAPGPAPRVALGVLVEGRAPVLKPGDPQDADDTEDGHDHLARYRAKTAETKRRYQELRRTGLGRRAAAMQVGVSARHGYRWEEAQDGTAR